MVKVSLSFAAACRILSAGGAVTVAFGEATEWEWRYGTLRLRGGEYQTRLPGGAWRALHEARDVHASGRDASVTAAYQGAGALAAAFESRRRSVLVGVLGAFQLLACIPCRECGKLLSRPCHIREGVGPECSGKYKEQRARAEARRAHWSADPFAALREREEASERAFVERARQMGIKVRPR